MITIGLAVLLAIASLMAACSMPHDNNNWDMNMTSTTRMATTKTLLRPRPLPDMSEGGMIFFLHVPKTGGTTLKSNFDETTSPNGFRVRARNNNVKESKFSRRIKYISGNWRSNLDSKFDYIKEFLTCHATERRKKYDKPVLFVEVHGMDSYNAIELQEFIKEWRSLAKIGGVPFFAFTMLREALSAQVSFFNFITWCFRIVALNKFQHTCRHARLKSSYSSLGRITILSACFWRVGAHLWRTTRKLLRDALEQRVRKVASHEAWYSGRKNANKSGRSATQQTSNGSVAQQLTRAECSNVYSVLQESMDWIGVLDRCNEETFPMLTQMIYNNASLASELVRARPSDYQQTKRLLQLQSVSKATMEQLERKSQMDIELYRRASREYTTDMWTNFPSDPGMVEAMHATVKWSNAQRVLARYLQLTAADGHESLRDEAIFDCPQASKKKMPNYALFA